MTSQERHLLTTLARLVRGSGLGTRADKQDLATAIALVDNTPEPSSRPQENGQGPAQIEWTEAGPLLTVFGVHVHLWAGVMHDSYASNLRDEINAAYAARKAEARKEAVYLLARYRYATQASLSAMFADGRASAVPLMWARAHDDGSKDINAETLHAQLEQWAKEKHSGAPPFSPDRPEGGVLSRYRYAVHRALRVMFGQGGEAARPLTWALSRDAAHNVFDDAPLLRDFEEWNAKTPRAPSAPSQDAKVLARYRYAAFFATTMTTEFHNAASRRLAWARSKDPGAPMPLSALDGPDNEYLAASDEEKGAAPRPGPDNPTRAGVTGQDLEKIQLSVSALRVTTHLNAYSWSVILAALDPAGFEIVRKARVDGPWPDGSRHFTQRGRDGTPEEVFPSADALAARAGASPNDIRRAEPLMRPLVPGQAGPAVPWIEDMTPEELREIAVMLATFASIQAARRPGEAKRAAELSERCREIAGVLEAIRVAGKQPWPAPGTPSRDLKVENAQLQLAIDEAFKILDRPDGTGAQARQERARMVLLTALSPAAPAPSPDVVSSWQEETQRLRGIIREAHLVLIRGTIDPTSRVEKATGILSPGLTPPVVQPPEEEPAARPSES